ncbi:hypothetical protein AB3X94_37285 [Paraburkholderia sp. BR10923]|uniref:hypothetical protein n=1 Tax=Paraburkholderia sp. BR10923 TaxID=3236992 RepID=UPI0034CF5F52
MNVIDGGPYYPQQTAFDGGEVFEQTAHGWPSPHAVGVSKRERFALEIMCALVAKGAASGMSRDMMVDVAVELADMLIGRTSH